MGALFTGRVRDEMAARGGGAVTESSAQLDASSLAKLPDAAREAYEYAVASGTHIAFLVGGSVAVVALVAAFFVQEVPLRGTAKPEAAPGDEGDEDGAGTGPAGASAPKEPQTV